MQKVVRGELHPFRNLPGEADWPLPVACLAEACCSLDEKARPPFEEIAVELYSSMPQEWGLPELS